MKIAIGGMQKNLMEQEIKKACPDAETIVTNDMNAASMMKKGEVDYYIGACESGSGSAISILIGLVGYSKCCTVCKNGGKPNKENYCEESLEICKNFRYLFYRYSIT